jgi:hypothetical protein
MTQAKPPRKRSRRELPIDNERELYGGEKALTPSGNTSEAGEWLAFRVGVDEKKAFKIAAVQAGLTQTELFLRIWHDWQRQNR